MGRDASGAGGEPDVLTGGERLLGGGFEVAYTPGHASHHVSYLHDGTAFVGDVGGVRITPSSMTIPPTPPPDIDVEAWHESIALIRSWRPERLADDPLRGQRRRSRANSTSSMPGWTSGRSWPATGGRDGFIAAVQERDPARRQPRAGGDLPAGRPAEQLYAGLRALLEQARPMTSSGAREAAAAVCWRAMSLTVELPRVRAGRASGLGGPGGWWSSTTTSTRSIMWPRPWPAWSRA